MLGDKTLPRDVPVARSSEPDGDALMSETALLHVLRHHRFLHEYVLAQQSRAWRPQARLAAADRSVGVMGLGMIGLPAAKTLRDHGFKVAGWSRTAKVADGIAVFHGREQLPDFLARSEIVVNLLALTPATENILCAATFARLPKGAAVINLARGQHVVDADLIAALDSGHLAAATLDAFRIEPLPAESPLWAHPRITITPHVARRLRPRSHRAPHLRERAPAAPRRDAALSGQSRRRLLSRPRPHFFRRWPHFKSVLALSSGLNSATGGNSLIHS